MADMGLTAADAQMDGLLLDATSGDWYDPNDVLAVHGVTVNGGGHMSSLQARSLRAPL